MEDQDQKTEALKKAYAEIILNTAKEAAARAMVSERKALRFQHDLCSTKDEALRMLLRFKYIIDAKTTEAEMTMSGKQKRIEELDARLNETEGVIVDLREELRKAHERLEEVKKSHMLQSKGSPGNEHMNHSENTGHDKKIDVSEHFKSSSECGRCCESVKEMQTSGPRLDSFVNDTPNLASIIIESKEPEFCRNGYTHRIRAIESNLVDGKNISEDKPAQELIINMDEKSLEKCASSSLDAENTDAKNIMVLEALPVDSSSVAKDQPIRAQRLPRNSGRCAQSSPKLTQICHGQSIKLTAEPEMVDLNENSLGKDEKLTETNGQSGCTLRRSIRKRKLRCFDDISSLFKSHAALSRCKKKSGNEGVKFDERQYKSKSVAETNIPISPSTNACEETKDDELPGPPPMYAVEDTKMLNESAKESSSCKVIAEADSIVRADKNRLLKYTFSRKRKKNLLSKSDAGPGKSFLKPSSSSPEQEKASLTEDPSGDNQNMVEVACQLISLSEKSSW